MAEETKDTKETTTGAEAEKKETSTKSEGSTATKTEAEIREEIRAELKAEHEKETDRRVTDALKKRDKEWEDKQKKAKMTEEERKQAEEKERLQAQAKKDLDLTIKGLKLDVVDAVAEMGLDAGFRNLIAVEDLAMIADEEERKTALTNRVKGMKALFDDAVAKEVAKEKANFLKGSTPPTGEKKKEASKYEEAKKAGNVDNMISEKLSAYHKKGEN